MYDCKESIRICWVKENESTRTVVFKYNPWHGAHNADIEEIEVDDNATEEEINEMWQEWLWEKVSDHATWYEKE